MQRHLYQRCLLTPKQVIVAAPGRGRSEGWDRSQPFPIWRWPGGVHGIPGWRRLTQTAWGFAALYHARRHYRVHSLELGQALPFGVIALWARARWGLPYRLWAFGDEFIKPASHPVGRALLKPVLAGAEEVYAISHYTAALVRPWLSAPDHVRVVHPWPANIFTPGSKITARARLGLSPRAPLLLTVGRFDPRKGVDRVLRALSFLMNTFPDLRYAVVGAGTPPPSWRALAQHLQVAERILWVSDADDDALVAWYRAADVFVLVPTPGPGEVEGFGMVFVEAGACGTPAVAGVNGGTPEAVLHNRTGLLAFDDSPPALARAIATLLQDTERRATMGRNAVARAQHLREKAHATFH